MILEWRYPGASNSKDQIMQTCGVAPPLNLQLAPPSQRRSSCNSTRVAAFTTSATRTSPCSETGHHRDSKRLSCLLESKTQFIGYSKRKSNTIVLTSNHIMMKTATARKLSQKICSLLYSRFLGPSSTSAKK